MLGGEPDLDAAERWVDNWQSGIAERAAQASALAQRLTSLTATARSRDGLVEVSVGSSGTVTDLRLDDRIQRQPAAATARLILATMRAAQAQLTRHVSEVAAETVGLDSQTGQAVVASYAARFPDPVDSDGR